MPGKLFRPSEVAERLGVEPQTVTRYIREGRLAATETAGGHYRISEGAMLAFLGTEGLAKTSGAVILAIAHHAGGVGKTTTTVNLAFALARAGQRVCVVDLDPQGDLSERLNVSPTAPSLSAALTVAGHEDVAGQRCTWDGVGFDVIPSSLDVMAGVELALVSVINGREQRLRRVIGPLRARYDYILLDCPPNLSLLMVNALYAADGVIVPVQAQDKAYRQLEKVISTIAEVNEYRDPATPVQVFGLLLTMVDRTNMARDVEATLRQAYGGLVFQTTIPRRTDTAADSRFAAPVAVYAPSSETVAAHTALAQEVISRAHP